jgi:signal transduction histidine kinase
VRNLLELRATERELACANERLEQRVAERTGRLRDLALHLEQNREDERRRIARDLHDEMGQLLTALHMELDLARAVPHEPSLDAIFDRTSAVLDQAFEATRALVGELRPRILDDLGLGAAAEWYLERVARRAGPRCEFTIDPPDLVASPAASTAAFRILQEALTNVQRHSGAGATTVRLAYTDGEIELAVTDDGRGFDTASVRAGYGLLGMRERAEALGGALEIESATGRGTRLLLRLPAD